MDFHDLDPETLALIVQLQLADLQDLANITEASTDLGSALAATREEVVSAIQTVADEQLATAIDEDDTNNDFDVDNTTEGFDFPNAEATNNLRALGASPLRYATSQDNSAPEREPEPETKACICCHNRHPPSDLVECPCSHTYCQGCIQALFDHSFADTSLFPPRCCRLDISLQAARRFLTQEAVDKYEAKAIELSTPNPTYCWNPDCTTFIHSENMDTDERRARCGKCGRMTCVECKSNWHGRQGECPIQETLRIAQQEGWQRCPVCRNLIELSQGCYHMTCICRAQFCYLCTAPWKTCQCAQWDEDRLLARAEEIIDRGADGQGVAARQRDMRLEMIRRELLARHECGHRQWRSHMGRFQCEGCWASMSEFIYECRQCGVVMCRGCRLNRL